MSGPANKMAEGWSLIRKMESGGEGIDMDNPVDVCESTEGEVFLGCRCRVFEAPKGSPPDCLPGPPEGIRVDSEGVEKPRFETRAERKAAAHGFNP